MITASELRKITEENGDELQKKFTEWVEDFEKRMREAAKNGKSEIFFTYTQGGTPFNNRRLYERLKEYFISKQLRIVKYDTRYDGCGNMVEYSKEYITW